MTSRSAAVAVPVPVPPSTSLGRSISSVAVVPATRTSAKPTEDGPAFRSVPFRLVASIRILRVLKVRDGNVMV